MVAIAEARVGFRNRGLARHARQIADAAADLVRYQFGSLPYIELLLTSDTNHFAEVAARSELALVEGVSSRAANKELRMARSNARGKAGITVLREVGVLVVANLANVPDKAAVNSLLVHEFTHGHQLGDPASRKQHLEFCAHAYGVARLPRRTVRQIEVLIDSREDQAYAAERLATQLPA
ncbi:hypothetical protein JK359_33405 [Streptomyces actinomycinicus]|uniref:Uncharacterized protein n=1 Tax=Streptomyces actinomycinicus TaxID=1695166 RepID=A0A937ERT8_9ACTN|nr:hypothetical protein [Streptomyces actinomycinicus]MBL1086804.1 hypothetical protein [Streptomyces actinomycinicus]